MCPCVPHRVTGLARSDTLEVGSQVPESMTLSGAVSFRRSKRASASYSARCVQRSPPVTKILPLLLLACAGVVGCETAERARDDAKPAGELAEARSRTTTVETSSGGDGLRNGKGTGRGRGRRKAECPVLVDGTLRAALRYHELPPSTPTVLHPLDDGRLVERFALSGYLASLGVQLSRVRALHLHGGDGRISVLDGEELRRVGDRLQIHFTGERGGRPTFKYPGVALRTNTTIDGIHALAVYVEKDAPTYHRGRLRVGETDVDAGVPAAKLALRGTRVYRDGRLLGTFRRRDVEGQSRPLVEALAALGASLDGVVAVELVGANEQVELLEPGAAAATMVTAARGGHGRLTTRQASEPETLDAVLLYARQTPSTRNARAKNDHVDAVRLARLDAKEIR